MSEDTGLLAVQNSVSDADLIAELTVEVDKAVNAHETENAADQAKFLAKHANTLAALEALDEGKPAVEVKGERVAGITEDAVAGDKAGEQTPSDRTILRDQLSELAAPAAAAASGPSELEQLRAANAALIQGKLADPVAFLKSHGLSPEQLIQQQNTPESVAQRALAAAQAAQSETESYRQELATQNQQNRLATLKAGVVDYATAQGDKYPLVNDGHQGLAFDAMVEAQEKGEPISEDQALVLVEGKLRAYVEKAAARLGLVRPGENSNAVAPSNAPAPQAVTLNAETPSTPPSKAWNDLSFEERDLALLKLL